MTKIEHPKSDKIDRYKTPRRLATATVIGALALFGVHEVTKTDSSSDFQTNQLVHTDAPLVTRTLDSSHPVQELPYTATATFYGDATHTDRTIKASLDGDKITIGLYPGDEATFPYYVKGREFISSDSAAMQPAWEAAGFRPLEGTIDVSATGATALEMSVSGDDSPEIVLITPNKKDKSVVVSIETLGQSFRKAK